MKGGGKMKERKIEIGLEGVEAKVIYHQLKGFEVKTLLLSFDGPRRVLSTMEGFKEVRFVGNHYDPPELWDYLHEHFEEHRSWLPQALRLPPEESAFLFTGADMDNLGVGEESFEELWVCCLATAGVKSNALRAGVDKAGSQSVGTINLILLTSAALTDGAMAGAVITATEAKTSILQDLDVRSSYNPQLQATGTGTDNLIIIPGSGPFITYTGGHAKIGELIGVTVRKAVAEALAKQEGIKESPVGRRKRLGEGYIQVYTGNGKGKTTASLGLAFRAAGHGLKTYIGQFMKGQRYGELEAVKLTKPYITIEQYGQPGWVHAHRPPKEDDIQLAREGLRKAREAMQSGEYDIIVLDEITTAYYFKLISLEDMLELVRSKPEDVELIFTGRYAPQELIEAADLVTEMREVKHYYQKGVRARDGIER